MEPGDLQRLFNRVIEGQAITIAFFDRRSYESCRVALVRKFTAYKRQLDSIGASESVEGKYLKCSFRSKTAHGTFQLADEEIRQRPYIVVLGEL